MRCKGNAFGRRARTSIITHGTQYDGTIINLAPVSTYTNYSTLYASNPYTGGTWSWSEIDNLEIGVSIRREGFCTQVWAEVYYTY